MKTKVEVYDGGGTLLRVLGKDEEVRVQASLSGGSFAVGPTLREGQHVRLFVDDVLFGIYLVTDSFPTP